ncbi:MAG: ASPIC/UnbV domain-containing protein [Phycisphaerales bacterium]|nr:ASPIC/UnbV domain-containing protein [Phycisphaerales bacterium]
MAYTVGDRTWRHDVFVGGSFYSAPPLEAHFGLGAVDTIDELRVVFPSGREAVLTDIDPNQLIIVTEPM